MTKRTDWIHQMCRNMPGVYSVFHRLMDWLSSTILCTQKVKICFRNVLEELHSHIIQKYQIFLKENAHLQVVMLSFLFSFEIESCQTSKIFLTNSFINCGSTTDTFPVVVSCVCPPISLGFDIPQNHVLHWCWKARHLMKQNNLVSFTTEWSKQHFTFSSPYFISPSSIWTNAAERKAVYFVQQTHFYEHIFACQATLGQYLDNWYWWFK